MNEPHWPDVAVVVVCLFAYVFVAAVDAVYNEREQAQLAQFNGN